MTCHQHHYIALRYESDARKMFSHVPYIVSFYATAVLAGT